MNHDCGMRLNYGLTTLSLILISTAAFNFNESSRDGSDFSSPENKADKQKYLKKGRAFTSGSIEWISEAPVARLAGRSFSSDRAPLLEVIGASVKEELTSEEVLAVLTKLEVYQLAILERRLRSYKEKKFIDGRFGKERVPAASVFSSPEQKFEHRGLIAVDSKEIIEAQGEIASKIEYQGDGVLGAWGEISLNSLSYVVKASVAFNKSCDSGTQSKCRREGGTLYIHIMVDHEVYRLAIDLNRRRNFEKEPWIVADLSGCGPKVSRRLGAVAVKVPYKAGEVLRVQYFDLKQNDWGQSLGQGWAEFSYNFMEDSVAEDSKYYCQ